MTQFPVLQILEGDNNLSLSLQGEDENLYLFGDASNSVVYELSKKLDHLRTNYYSPLYKQYVPSNSGYLQANQTLQGNDGNLYHFTENGNFIGCSLCDSKLLNGEATQWNHYNADGTLAGITSFDDDGNDFLYEGGFELSGFKLGKMKIGGFKMPKMGSFKMPKLSMPKLKISMPKLPNFKMPKLPNFKMPKLPNFKVPDIGKGLSKIGSKIGKALDTHVRKVGEAFDAAGNMVSSLAESATGLATGLMDSFNPNSQKMAQEQAQEEEQGLTQQDPGYSDENGYTASDGVYYSHDNQYYFDFQTNQWIPLNQESSDPFKEIGYSDENGYRSNDGLFYSHDGQYVLNEQTNEWIMA